MPTTKAEWRAQREYLEAFAALALSAAVAYAVWLGMSFFFHRLRRTEGFAAPRKPRPGEASPHNPIPDGVTHQGKVHHAE